MQKDVVWTKQKILEDIVENHQSRKITFRTDTGKQRQLIIDAFSAQIMLAVAKKLSEEARQKFYRLDWIRMQTTAFQLAYKKEKAA